MSDYVYEFTYVGTAEGADQQIRQTIKDHAEEAGLQTFATEVMYHNRSFNMGHVTIDVRATWNFFPSLRDRVVNTLVKQDPFYKENRDYYYRIVDIIMKEFHLTKR
jgi:hypothetical protein